MHWSTHVHSFVSLLLGWFVDLLYSWLKSWFIAGRFNQSIDQSTNQSNPPINPIHQSIQSRNHKWISYIHLTDQWQNTGRYLDWDVGGLGKVLQVCVTGHLRLRPWPGLLRSGWLGGYSRCDRHVFLFERSFRDVKWVHRSDVFFFHGCISWRNPSKCVLVIDPCSWSLAGRPKNLKEPDVWCVLISWKGQFPKNAAFFWDQGGKPLTW